MRNSIAKNIVISIPDYAHALLCVNKLALEVLQIQLLPNANVDEKNMPKAYNLDEFNERVSMVNFRSKASLDRFFIFIKHIILEVRESYFEKLRFYQRVLNQEDIV